MGEVWSFFEQLVAHPKEMGAVVPSSRALTDVMLREFDPRSHQVVLELGAGTGVFTSMIHRKMGGRGHLVLVERNPELASMLKKKFPHALVICDCASKVRSHMHAHGIDHVDFVVSGIPWTLFPRGLQSRIISEIRGIIRPGGIFVMFIYTHAIHLMRSAMHLERLLRFHLGPIRKSRTVWMNLPPAQVWSWCAPVASG